MSDPKSEPKQPRARRPESQGRRWIKYGSNVLLASIVVIVLAAALTAISQRLTRRFNLRSDVTASGIQTLRPQTVNIVKDVKQKIRLVGLYPYKENRRSDQDFRRPVADILDQYARQSANVTAEMIDPTTDQTRMNDLFAQATSQYGSGLDQYKTFLDDFKKLHAEVTKFAADEYEFQRKLSQSPPPQADKNLAMAMQAPLQGREEIQQGMDSTAKQIEREQKTQLPDYKGAAELARQQLDTAGRIVDAMIRACNFLKLNSAAPDAMRGYAASAVSRFEALNKQIAALQAESQKLGELKQLQEIRNLSPDSILVMGAHDIRVLSFDQIWPVRQETLTADSDAPPRRRFAGEQQITTAILSLTQKVRPKVVFVRAGGMPLATLPTQADRGGPLSSIGAMLRSYNFDVLEKDLTGDWPRTAILNHLRQTPEATDEQLKDAVWVVADTQGPAVKVGRMGEMKMNPIGGKLAEHLKQGGSALVLFLPESDPLTAALKDWGVTAKTDAIIVHQRTDTGDSAAREDVAEQLQHYPFIFVLDRYGQHPLVKPLQSLDLLLGMGIPVSVTPTKGYTSTPLLPIPPDPKSWAESDLAAVQHGQIKYDAGAGGDAPNGAASGGDVLNTAAGPLYVGAAVEKEGGGRLVALGSLSSFANPFLMQPNRQLLDRGIWAARFPGNADLFANSIYWLAHMDTMIAISPRAMEVSRIAPMSDRTLAMWRIGLPIVLLPLAVLGFGTVVYLRRRD